MGLPKLDTPTYRLTLPSTGEEIQYRPFLVKEQKLLMMAQESEKDDEIIQCMTQVIDSCTFSKVNVLTSPMFDVEYVFLKIRSKAVGEKVEVNILCPDDEETYVPVEIDLANIEVQMSNDHTNEINITDTVKIVMKYPQMNDMKGMKIGDSVASVATVFNILKSCILEIHDGDVIHKKTDMSKKELSEFLDQLNTKQFEDVMNFFEMDVSVRMNTNIRLS